MLRSRSLEKSTKDLTKHAPKEILYVIMLKLRPYELRNFCKTDKRARDVCKSLEFQRVYLLKWRKKVNWLKLQDYQLRDDLIFGIFIEEMKRHISRELAPADPKYYPANVLEEILEVICKDLIVEKIEELSLEDKYKYYRCFDKRVPPYGHKDGWYGSLYDVGEKYGKDLRLCCNLKFSDVNTCKILKGIIPSLKYKISKEVLLIRVSDIVELSKNVPNEDIDF